MGDVGLDVPVAGRQRLESEPHAPLVHIASGEGAPVKRHSIPWLVVAAVEPAGMVVVELEPRT